MALCNIEIFDRDFNCILHQQADQPDIVEDYLSPETFEVVLFAEQVSLKGAYIHISGDIDYVGVVAEVTYDTPREGQMSLSITSIISFFDVNFLFDTDYQGSSVSLEAFMSQTIGDIFITNADAEQCIPGLTTVTTSTTVGWGFHITSTEEGQHSAIINLYDTIIYRALEKYGVTIRPSFDFAEKTITLYIGTVTGVKVVEADLPNILSRSITETTTKNAVNKLIVYNTDGYSQFVVYYLHPDGSYDGSDVDRITPVVLDVQGAKAEEASEGQTARSFPEVAADIAARTFGQEVYRDLIEVEVLRDDALVTPLDLSFGQVVTIKSGGKTYRTILTAREIARTVKLTFGIVRVDLTKTLTGTITEKILNSQTIQQIKASAGGSGGGNYLTRADVIDNLTSAETNLPLSANQGRLLKNDIPIIQSGAWPVHLYDQNTFKRTIGTGRYYKIGGLIVAYFTINAPDLSGVTTMMQFRGFPAMAGIIMGQIYAGKSATALADKTLQVTLRGYDSMWFKPNIKSSDFTNPGSPGVVTMCIIGITN